MATLDDQDTADFVDGPDESQVHRSACTNCRRKKQKCSREDPCRSCVAIGGDCVYEEGQKRGAKPGYIETLMKRMDSLESLVLGQSLLISPVLAEGTPSSTNGSDPLQSLTLSQQLQAVRQNLLGQRHKRRRTKSNSEASPLNGPPVGHTAVPPASAPRNGANSSLSIRSHTGNNLPPPSMLRDLIDIYFSHIHPWIPILHRPDFEASLVSKDDRPSEVVLQAITAATIKFYSVDHQAQEWYHSRCHDAVVLACMDRFSVETLQASIILAFNTIGSGKGPRSWSIVASATRIVEQLGLAVEEEDAVRNKMLNRIGFLRPAKNWTEKESLRRIFWCIFLLDRFCSVATGWNTSLTSTDIKRRLPAEGCLWRDRIEKKARYFNVDTLAAEEDGELDALGGLAYLVEASECLSRVASFLLQESVDLTTGDSLRRWFERFQSLDAMLVRWKTFLPARWQVAGIDATGKMDENLTLAHITHNTSVIMLHQNIAYLDAGITHQLPFQNAAKTCLAAAGEIATIAAKFMANTTVVIPPTFSFCLFIAARVLLADSNHFNNTVDPNFEILLQALRDASERWTARGLAFASDNLAGQFADRIDAAWRSRSPINVHTVALQGDGGALPISLASPPLPDIFGAGLVNTSSTPFDFGLDDNGATLHTDLESFDRIFTWTDEMIGG